MFIYILLFAVAYSLGSIPTSYWVGKYIYGIDIRNHGSGNSGATNTARVLGYKVAIPVLIFDLMKGFAATRFTAFIPDLSPGDAIYFQVFFGLTAMVGHIFPIFANFRGGKGVAVLTGLVIGLNPTVALFCVVIFVLTVGLTKMVSLGSLISALSIPFIYYFIIDSKSIFVLSFSFAIFLIVVVTHIENIKRIIAGEENTISFKKNK